MLRDQVLQIVLQYIDAHPKECGLSRLLRHIEASDKFWSRKEVKGHITCSAVLINPDLRVLQVHHRGLDRWLFPGGHVEYGDQSLPEAALREVEEEVAISRAHVMKAFERDVPIDINCHVIPRNQANAEPRHIHWDFRYAFFTNRGLVRCKRTEIKAAAWREIRELDAPIVVKLNSLLSDAKIRRSASPW
jgi:8-oxo-dGTP pyrophosphatase MutT (NUDIX family)